MSTSIVSWSFFQSPDLAIMHLQSRSVLFGSLLRFVLCLAVAPLNSLPIALDDTRHHFGLHIFDSSRSKQLHK